jgi:hypothetical protein
MRVCVCVCVYVCMYVPASEELRRLRVYCTADYMRNQEFAVPLVALRAGSLARHEVATSQNALEVRVLDGGGFEEGELVNNLNDWWSE